ncbi:MAG: T9SS type A sorting domain-containing protein [Ginsengibacter sp.]
MNKFYSLFIALIFISLTYNSVAQVVMLDDNHSLEGFTYNGKIFLISNADSTIWTSDGTPSGTNQLATVKVDNTDMGILNNIIYFTGINAANGSELWQTDGTAGNTKIVADIQVGIASSTPDNFFTYNNKLYFTATTPANGRELYEYTGAGSPTRITDINPGAGDGFNNPNFYIQNNIVYFDATNGTDNALYTLKTGVVAKLMDIPVGSQFNGLFPMSNFAHLGNTVFFSLFSSTALNLYKTDGTPSGTSLVRAFSGLFANLFFQMIPFNNKLFLSVADVGMNIELWSTDGTTTKLVKEINPGPNGSVPLLLSSVILNNKLIFMASSDASGFELWSTDGSEVGTTLIKDINTNPGEGSDPTLMPVFIDFDYSSPDYQSMDFYNRTANFNGYIFFSADDGSSGLQLWKTNGTTAGTIPVKILNPGADGVGGSYIYTASGIVFSGNDGTNGMEPWFSDGTEANTKPIANINPSPMGDADPGFLFIWKGDIYLSADNGNGGGGPDVLTDFYKLQGPYFSLPISLLNFNAQAGNSSVQLTWNTATESNSDHFGVQRSIDGVNFSTIGKVDAAGNSSTTKEYIYNDNQAYTLGESQLYYRLELVDKDGRKAYSKIVTVTLTLSPNMFTIFPNPVHDFFTIRYSSQEKSSLFIFDINGKQVYRGALEANNNGTQKVDVSNLPAGTYIIKSVSNQRTETQKLIKK